MTDPPEMRSPLICQDERAKSQKSKKHSNHCIPSTGFQPRRLCKCRCHEMVPPRPQASPVARLLPPPRRTRASQINAPGNSAGRMARVVDAIQPAAATAETPDQEYDREELSDLRHATMLLAGVWTQQGAKPNDRFPNKRYISGELEQNARQAIGRLLRSENPLDRAIRFRLAELFDGMPPHSSPDSAPMVRTIVFAFGRAGTPKAGTPKEKQLRDLHLASDYRTLIDAGMPRKKAIAELCSKYGVSDTVVGDALRSFKRRIERS